MVLTNRDGMSKGFGSSSQRFLGYGNALPGPGAYKAPEKRMEGVPNKKGLGSFASKS
jgi:hypothetical protein